MFCQNCGSKNDDNVKFCFNCGALIQNISIENNNKKDGDFISSDNFIKIKSQIDSIKDQPDTALSDDNINQISEIIKDDESILYFISGFAAFGDDSLLVILTSKRIIITIWGIFKPIKEKISIPLDSINKVSSSIGIMGIEITIEHGNNSEYITNIGKESGKLFEYKINKELDKYQNKIQIKETNELKERDNHNLNGNSIENNNIDFHTVKKERYLFLKNRHVNCSCIQEIKREENTILIMTSKNVHYLKYSDEDRAINNYEKLISFITNEVLEISDDEK